jgi:signal peptidase I
MILRIVRAAPAGALLAGLLVGAVSTASAVAVPTPAAAAPTREVVTGQHLQLTSLVEDGMEGLGVGETAAWDVGLRVLTPGEATVAVSLEVLEATEDAFAATVQRCDVPWADDACASGAVALASTVLAPGSGRQRLDRVAGEESPWYRVAVTRVGGDGGATTTLRVHADGAGDEVSTGAGGGEGAAGPGAEPPGSGRPDGSTGGLPSTGAAPAAGLLLAAGAMASGLALAQVARRRRDRGSP